MSSSWVDDQTHLDAWADTHHGYTARCGGWLRWWSDYVAVADTSAAAIERYKREHEQPILDRDAQRHGLTVGEPARVVSSSGCPPADSVGTHTREVRVIIGIDELFDTEPHAGKPHTGYVLCDTRLRDLNPDRSSWMVEHLVTEHGATPTGADDLEWCTTPGCVRPMNHRPNSMHLSEDGLEFQGPTLRPVT